MNPFWLKKLNSLFELAYLAIVDREQLWMMRSLQVIAPTDHFATWRDDDGAETVVMTIRNATLQTKAMSLVCRYTEAAGWEFGFSLDLLPAFIIADEDGYIVDEQLAILQEVFAFDRCDASVDRNERAKKS